MLKNVRKNYLLASIFYILLGIVLVIMPETTTKTIWYSFGAIMVVVGVVYTINYFTRETVPNTIKYDLVIGLIGIVIGLFTFIKVNVVISIIPVILGFAIVITGIIKLQNALDLKRIGYARWNIILIFALINIVFGIVLLANPFASAKILVILIGIGLMFSGVTDIASNVIFTSQLKTYSKNSIVSSKNKNKSDSDENDEIII